MKKNAEASQGVHEPWDPKMRKEYKYQVKKRKKDPTKASQGVPEPWDPKKMEEGKNKMKKMKIPSEKTGLLAKDVKKPQWKKD